MKKSFILWFLPLSMLCMAGSCEKCDPPPPSDNVFDSDGNTYKTVTIGSQVWMAENLKTTKYNDGTVIPLVTDATAWSKLSTPAYCWYNNDAATNKNTYGTLYNWYTVNTGKLCPTGWHVPSETEWNTLLTYVGGIDIAAGKLKETGTVHWNIPNAGATNEYGFTALPGGCRAAGTDTYNMGEDGYWWFSTSYYNLADDRAYFIAFSRQLPYATIQSINIKFGLSVRCLKD